MHLSTKYKEYKEKAGIQIPYDVFMKPKELISFHEENVGTVVNKINNNLSVYPHIIYFGCMLFFTRLTRQLIEDGPIVFKTIAGQVCCF